ncbi:MAG: four helix bundle suffix domain-containing protein [Kiritimatiellae bacterium]|nr:four helix bundle suffix domain-containing protein [Kiritimatiellia bacterium]
MADSPKIVLPHGGYRNLIVYRKSEVIYQGTVTFCRRFLSAHGDRTVDQMTQAARSCKQNIAEGSSASGTSKETEIKLTNVARATLDELLEDYLDWLKSHGVTEWEATSEKKTAARDFSKKHADWNDWKPFFDSRPADTLCNLMIVIIQQTKYLLDKMIAAQEENFKKHGGVRERMHMARTAARGAEWEKAIFSRLDGAATAEELDARVEEMRVRISKAVSTIKRRKNW